jgi:hypothetical protein
MASYFNYTIEEFSVETKEGFIDLTQSISAVTYSENITSPSTYVSLLIVNTAGILSKLKLRGGERVRLIIKQDATGLKFSLDENNNTYYVYNIGNSTTESTKELFTIDLIPGEMFTNETTRVFRRYDSTLDTTVSKILKEELKTTRYSSSNIEKSVNKYSFMGNARKPFTVLGWLCPKGIPQVESGKSGNTIGTAGFLFFENKDGYNFKSVDSLFDKNRQPKETYSYREIVPGPADPRANFRITSPPTFKKNVNVLDNLRIGMYSNVNYFFDTNTRKFYANVYKLSESYDIMNHAGDDNPPEIPNGLQDSPSRLMVRMLDNGQMDKSGKLEAPDKRMEYQGQGVSRYNLLFSQTLNITVPLNLNLTVGDVINLEFGQITKEEDKKGLRDKSKSGKYIVSKLKHVFGGNKGLTGLELVRDSYGVAK